MMNRFFICLYFLCAGCTTVSMPRSHLVDTNISEISADVTENFWTSDAMAAAKPFPTPYLSESEVEALLKSSQKKPGLEIDSIPAQPQMYANPARADINTLPYKNGGKLFFTLKGNKYSCSAQFAGHSNVLLTAAHCVRSTDGTWATNVIFVQAFEDGKGTRFNVKCMKASNFWVTGGAGRYAWDYAFLRTDTSSASGNVGITFQLSVSSWQAIGYPKNFEMAKFMQKVDGTKGLFSGSVIEMKGNGMREGNSGGAWLSGSTAIGLNSFHKKDNTTDEWSPDFNRTTRDVFDAAVKGC